MDEFLSAVQVWFEYIGIGFLFRIGWRWCDWLLDAIKSLFRRHD